MNLPTSTGCHTRSRTMRISCSLSGSASSSNPASRLHGCNPSRRRVAATVTDAPSQTKDEATIQRLRQQQQDLDATFWLKESNGHYQPELEQEQSVEQPHAHHTVVSVVEEEVTERVGSRRKSPQFASTLGLDLHLGNPSGGLVPSTRISRSKRGGKVLTSPSLHTRRHVVLNVQQQPSKYSDSSSSSGGNEELSEFEADAVFLAKLRTWLRNNRSKQGSRNMKTRTAGITSSSIGASTFSHFLSSLGNIPLLSAKQEQRLAFIIGRGIAVRAAAVSLVAAGGKRPSLEDVAKEAGLPSAQAAARAVVMAEDARGLFADFNIRMVISLAKRYMNKGLDASDLIPEGIIGLKKAIEKFDPSKGFRFSTYAHWWIRQSITRAISEQGRDVRLPVHVVETLMRLNKVRKELSSQPDRVGPPTHKELAVAMGLPLPRLIALMRSTRPCRSVEDFMSNGPGGGSFGGGMKDMGKDGPLADDIWVEESVDDFNGDPIAANERMEYMRETLTLLLSTLDTRERNIMRLRYGLHYNNSPASIKRALEAIEEGLKAEAAASESLDDGGDQMMLMDMDLFASGNSSNRLTPEDVAVDWENGDLSYNLKATGALYHLSRERIRQVESKAIKKLRTPWRLRLIERIKEGEPLTQKDVDRLMQAAAEANGFF